MGRAQKMRQTKLSRAWGIHAERQIEAQHQHRCRYTWKRCGRGWERLLICQRTGCVIYWRFLGVRARSMVRLTNEIAWWVWPIKLTNEITCNSTNCWEIQYKNKGAGSVAKLNQSRWLNESSVCLLPVPGDWGIWRLQIPIRTSHFQTLVESNQWL